jgi:hypothetical protein
MKTALKYVFSYVIAFLVMTAFMTLVSVAVLAGVIGIISFVSWQIPAVLPPLWGTVRLIVSLGMVTGLCFTFSSEGKAFVDNLVGEQKNK